MFSSYKYYLVDVAYSHTKDLGTIHTLFSKWWLCQGKRRKNQSCLYEALTCYLANIRHLKNYIFQY